MTSATDWSGRVGDVWAREWVRTDRSFADLARYLDAAILDAAPAGPFTALDIGSGAGATSLALATARPDATVIGVDLSPGLVDVARQRGAHLPNLRFETGDVVEHAAALRPDLLVSRHGVMFFPDPNTAFSALRRAAAPGARLVFSCFAGIEDNPWATVVSDTPVSATGYAPGPFAFADPEFVRSVLSKSGWVDLQTRRVRFAYRAGEGADPVEDAFSFFSRIGPAASALRDAAHTDRPALEARLRERLAAQRQGGAVDFPSAAWLWSATAGEPS